MSDNAKISFIIHNFAFVVRHNHVMQIYRISNKVMTALLIAAAIAVVFFMGYSSRLVSDLSEQERERVELWADATRRLAADSIGGADVDFMLSVIESNRSIPVLLADADNNILLYRNFLLPEPDDSLGGLSDANMTYLKHQLWRIRQTGQVIDIRLAPDVVQHLYYDDSSLLKKLSVYPFLLMLVMVAFVVMVYFAVTTAKKAEQNKVWVGLSKETAHQLGTPISSLMAWTEILRDYDVPQDAVAEMEKDVKRLEDIASRFSKIGSRPELTPGSVSRMTSAVVEYMRRRVSEKVEWELRDNTTDSNVPMSEQLLEWVLENLIKNAVDAMGGAGKLTISVDSTPTHVNIDVSDTGCGIPHNSLQRIFRPGYSTRKRGWGLGLTLAKRIVDDYHRGRIYVKDSTPGEGTTFRIELPR